MSDEELANLAPFDDTGANGPMLDISVDGNNIHSRTIMGGQQVHEDKFELGADTDMNFDEHEWAAKVS